MYVHVCIVYCMYCFDLKWYSHVDSINDNDNGQCIINFKESL